MMRHLGLSDLSGARPEHQQDVTCLDDEIFHHQMTPSGAPLRAPKRGQTQRLARACHLCTLKAATAEGSQSCPPLLSVNKSDMSLMEQSEGNFVPAVNPVAVAAVVAADHMMFTCP